MALIVGDDGINTLQGSAGKDVIYGFDPNGPQGQVSSIAATRVASALTQPLFAISPPGDTARLFIVEKTGLIKILDLTTGQVLPTPFLDLTSQITTAGDQGLLGLAFHPDYASNGLFYVQLTNPSGDNEIRSYHVSASNPNQADVASVTPVITIDMLPNSNHHAGWIGFGPDGYLYASEGDSTDAPSAQTIDDLRGDILRINVNSDAFPADPARNYAIPPDNPYAGPTTGADEIFAIGLRNPWRPSFDRALGTFYIADVGENSWEEVDLGQLGANYGWPIFEGSHQIGSGTPTGGTATPPIFEYPHNGSSASITGGYVYRGSSEGLQGQYFFADFITSHIFTLRFDGTMWVATDRTSQVVPDVGAISNPSSFGEDALGNLYIVDFNGEVFRLTPTVASADQGDVLNGLGGDDFLFGGSGNDTLTGGPGNDFINGGPGTDSAIFSGMRSAYTLTALAGGATRVVGPDGTDMLTSVEQLVFDDQPPVFADPTFKLAAFGSGAGGWSSQNLYPRLLADYNNDGAADIFGFGASGVFLSSANPAGFLPPIFASGSSSFWGAQTGGWSSQDAYPREVAHNDLASIGEIVGFASNGVYVSPVSPLLFVSPPMFANGTSFWGAQTGGWSSQDKYPRELADINNDGAPDIVGFASNGVWVSLAQGFGFSGPMFMGGSFWSAQTGGWSSQDTYTRFMADADGDGFADIVGFAQGGAYVSLNQLGAAFLTPTFVPGSSFWGAQTGGWSSQNLYPRSMADVNGDGKADIVGFAQSGVYVSISTSTPGSVSFEAPTLVPGSSFWGASTGGWSSNDLYPRELANITTGDTKADIVGFAQSGVWTAISTVTNPDTVAPGVPIISQVTDDVLPVTGVVANGGSTDDTTPTVRISLSGTNAAAGDKVQLFNAISALGSAIGLTSGNISNGFVDVTTAALAQGTYNFNAKITDIAGNTSGASTNYSVTINSGAPQNVGSWSAVFPWPLIGLHCIMTPDGKILTYGTDQTGQQSGLHLLDVWDPATNTHTRIDCTTHTDVFCSVGLIVPETGQVLISGGDARPDGNVNAGVPDVNFYDPTTMTENPSSTGAMQFARWYASAVQLGTGQILVLGGRDLTGAGSAYAEVYTPGYGFHALTGTYIDTFGEPMLYPRAWLTSNGTVWTTDSAAGFDEIHGSGIYSINPTGAGSVQRIGQAPVLIPWSMPAIMFAPDKVLLIGSDYSAWIMDMSGPTPVFQRTDDVTGGRIWSNLVVLPDGRVMISGGSAVDNQLNGVGYTAAFWDPSTGHWTSDADAAIPRLYHSTTILLADGSVLSLGGGAPGPLTNLNGEIFKPGYLFDATGAPAVRPVIKDAPAEVLPGTEFTMHVDNPASIKTLALMPFGAVTHSFDMSARRLELPFTVQADGSLKVDLPANSNLLTPGYWMLFAINANGTPSIASTVQVETDPMLYDLPAQLPLNLLDANMVLERNGDAAYDAYNDRYVLTPDAVNKLGSFISPKRVDLSTAFDISFQINLGGKDAGGDGVGFVLHNDPAGINAIAHSIGSQGLKGIQYGLGITFATNGATDQTGFIKTADESALSVAVGLGNIEDGQWHQVYVVSNGQTISYTFDGAQMGTISLAAAKALLNGSNFAYFGFTGGTNNPATEEEQIQLLKLDANAEGGEQIHLDRADLPQPVTLITNGAATYDAANKSYVVTPDAQFQHGSVMASTRVDLSKAFKLTFDINVGNKDAGADGMGFVLHNDPAGINAIGPAGGGQGLMSLKNGVGITFATDAVTDQTGFVKTSDGSAQSTAVALGNIEDGLWHRVAIVSDGQTISYTFDGVQMSSLSLATVETVLGGTPFAYWGFTGATDMLSEQEQVRLVKMEATGADGTAYQIVGPNKDPVAVSDAYTVAENRALTVSAVAGVLANDYDPDGDPLRVCPQSRIVGHALLLAPSNGAVTMNEDGSFTYTPNAGFAGVDSFFYCTEDGPACVQGRVDITVTGSGTGLNTILGTSADDVLVGTAGNDFMSGLAGNDRLTGGLGNDTFVFALGFGNDTITDFSRAVGNRDIIDLSAFHFASGFDALSRAVASGADTIFNFGNGDTLTVQNTAAGNITNLLVDDLKLSSATSTVTSPTSGQVTADQAVTISLDNGAPPAENLAGPSAGNSTITGTTTLEILGASTANVSFASGAAGELKLDASSQFTGQVTGFAGQDQLDLAVIAFSSNTTLGYAANNNNTGGTLTVSDGTHTANIALLGQYMAASFVMSADGFGGTLIHDTPPATLTQTLTQPQHA